MTLISQYRRTVARAASAALALAAATACAPAKDSQPSIRVVAIERVYGDLARQLGGSRIDVTTILNSPSADPHAYEPMPRDADAISVADVVIVNGLGYDAFAQKLVAASPRAGRVVLDTGALGHHRTGDNPHVWYEPASLRTLANAVSREFVRRDPTERRMLETKRRTLAAWIDRYAARLARIGARHPGARVAITEPVFDYVLRGARIAIATPDSFSHAIEEGNDPAPQDVETMRALLADRRVSAFVYNDQTVEPSTKRLLDVARNARVTIVPITETLPDAETLQRWIDREVGALERAL
ncbi:MAG: metal ABC transporter solute-binding protein [Vulcanimicrobiaceae bacterium]